jgi:CheY-like chemotaxis protein
MAGKMKYNKEYKGLKVLVVEDNLINQKIMKAYLEKLGADCRIAVNGAEALTYFSEQNFDCVLMDIQMPVMDGIEATQRIRALEKSQGKYTPVIAVTASAPYEEQQEFIRMGFDEYVPKPVSLSVLSAIFTKVINKQ